MGFAINSSSLKFFVRGQLVYRCLCLSNMESLNAVFIDQGLPQGERLLKLNHIAILQMKVLENDGNKQLSKQNK